MRNPEPLCKVFDVRIGVRPGEPWVEVLDSPAGEGAAVPFVVPFAPGDLDLLDRRLAAAGRRPQRQGRGVWRHLRPLARPDDESWATAAGARLFEALLPGPLRALWERSVWKVEESGDHPRRRLLLRLRFDLRGAGGDLQAAGALLHRLPWELMCDPEQGEPLALGDRFSVARYLEVARPAFRPAPSGPLVVLAVSASPRGRDAPAQLDVGRELRGLREAVTRAAGTGGAVTLREIEHATLGRLRDALRREPVHVLHYMGHGDFDPATGEGVLVLEDETGAPVPVSADRLVEETESALSSVRLVVLNACRTAEAGGSAPYAGLATALVSRGVGAVVAMRRPITDGAAVAFSGRFYDRLAKGEAVDETVRAGRRAIRERDPRSAEWAIPALFLRADPEPLVRRDGPSRVAGGAAPRSWPRALAGALVLAALVSVALWTAGPHPGREPESPEAAHGFRRLRLGESSYLPEIGAGVTAEVESFEGNEMVRLTVSPDGGGMTAVALFAGESKEIPAPGGTIEIQLIALDRPRREVSLHVLRTRGPPD